MDLGDLQELQASYRLEAADLLADLGDSLLLLEQDQKNIDVINRVFRAMHTLKGSGASAGFRRLAGFIHHVEDVFNRIRNLQMETTSEVIDAALKACDCCAMLLDLGATDSNEPLPLETEVLDAIRPYLSPSNEAVRSKTATVSRPATYDIQFRPHREIFFSGTDPASLLFEVADLGKMDLHCNAEDLLACEDFDPEHCYLRWTLSVETDHPLESLNAIFQFVEDDSEISIQLAHPIAPVAAIDGKESRFRSATDQCFIALALALRQCQAADGPGEKQVLSTASRAAQTLLFVSRAHGHTAAVTDAQKLLDFIATGQRGVILDSSWFLQMNHLVAAVSQTVQVPAPGLKGIGTSSNAVSVTSPALAPPRNNEAAPVEAAAQSIRVDAAKLDALMRLAGELLVARGALPSFAERIERGDPVKTMSKEMRDAGAKVSRLADDLQATVMSIRMMPVRQVFQRFPRLVRDIARTLDKNIELLVRGEETELDKTVIDSIGDPLTHIIRNAADHGIESRSERLARGKPAVGRIELSAYTRGSNVVIEVKDDGKGLDAAKLKRRAVEKGLYSESAIAAMDEEAAFKIILAAGFSTVDTVTDLSGRGVGMDVVRNSVEALRGLIHIESVTGQGTCFRIELPASLLVSKGVLVSSLGERMVLPMETVRHMVKLPASVFRQVHDQQIAPVRGAVLPMVSLAGALSFPGGNPVEAREERSVAIIDATCGAYGLIVDSFHGEVEVVIKPLTGVLAHVQEFVGAAIMADGRTVLVVNTERLYTLLQSRKRTPRKSGRNGLAVVPTAAIPTAGNPEFIF